MATDRYRLYHDKNIVKMMKDVYEARGSNRSIARRFGLSHTTVDDVKRGKTWQPITDQDLDLGTVIVPKKKRYNNKSSCSFITAIPGTEPWKNENLTIKEKLTLAIEELLT